ncbi:hypothetical protein N7478_007907 [Penicillium angulare]|uniref:uncharacterized protein n=1 Tax=Penicillium angulare TaxID=116970 RepID=UPI002541F99A|nr:uncharacterized protein N7478_007907 [Penicillium angulare]KAJ5272782.1 hypothetical protein N7478_007907 [Penicillium angulare]
MPMVYQPYLYHEPRHVPPQEPPGYARPELSTLPGPRLPPLGQIMDSSLDPRYRAYSDNSYVNYQPLPQTLPLRMHHQGPIITDPRGDYTQYEERSSPILSHDGELPSHRLRTYDLESHHSSSSTALPSPIYSEKSPISFTGFQAAAIPANTPKESRQTGTASYSIPHGFDKILNHEPEPDPDPEPSPSPSPSSSPSPPPCRDSTQPRYHLHVRQQPVAARACGAGDRDRRPVDPPPIVQILLTDFDSESQDDKDILQDPRFTVGCLLFPVTDSGNWAQPPDTEQAERERDKREPDGVARADDNLSTPLLSGKAFMSPFYVDADPDPNSAPTHPSSDDTQLTSPTTQHPGLRNASKLHQPATFFIFADLSIRSAGLYRLQFRLMNWGSVEDTGQSMPILAEAWSDPFRVYPAKDFPGMRDSSILAEGLKELGFVELKTRGKGKGKGRKRS